MATAAAPLRRLLAEKRHYLVDLDGVVYHGSRLVSGADRAIRLFREMGKDVFFLTNNSTRHPKNIAEKLTKLGVACAVDDVVNSALGAAAFLRERSLDRPNGVLVIGTDELRALLDEHGIAVSSNPGRCSALLVGMDPDMSLATITRGLRALSRGVPFIACNRDANYPGEGGALQPGCGALVGALAAAAQRQPDHEIGKPSAGLMQMLLRRTGARREECLVFGDSLETDIAMANAAGIDSLWVRPPRMAPGLRRGGTRPTATVANLKEAAAVLKASARTP